MRIQHRLYLFLCKQTVQTHYEPYVFKTKRSCVNQALDFQEYSNSIGITSRQFHVLLLKNGIHTVL